MRRQKLAKNLFNNDERFFFSDEKRWKLSAEEKATLDKAESIAKVHAKAHKKVYQMYLNSDEWKKKRDFVLSRDNHICQFCGAEATEVHHLSYERKYNEAHYDLISICRPCHELIHKAGVWERR